MIALGLVAGSSGEAVGLPGGGGQVPLLGLVGPREELHRLVDPAELPTGHRQVAPRRGAAGEANATGSSRMSSSPSSGSSFVGQAGPFVRAMIASIMSMARSRPLELSAKTRPFS